MLITLVKKKNSLYICVIVENICTIEETEKDTSIITMISGKTIEVNEARYDVVKLIEK